ncbi:MAG TPA: choice-of-anchor tandem repeat GloVer-containing protein [Terriglobales bacterium]|nr:choice-of-anchor tandem repeat GloVer-containing protein [Terriglobales bacterium]
MTPNFKSLFRLPGRITRSLAVIALLAAINAASGMQAQTFTVIHSFTNGADGGVPRAGLTYISPGSFYGTTMFGGKVVHLCDWLDETPGCGTVFKLSHFSSGWILTPIYSFDTTHGDGILPLGRVTIAPDGTLYGTTLGGPGNTSGGTVFHLSPSPVATKKVALAPWNERVMYAFSGGSDGRSPTGDLIFDRSGSIYGSASVLYKLTSPGNGLWTETVIDPEGPDGGVILDSAGNLYGTVPGGDLYGCGGIHKWSLSRLGWIEQTLYNFTGGSDGCRPSGGLIVDTSGALYGTTTGQGGGGATVFKLTPSTAAWSFELLFSFTDGGVPQGKLLIDAAGNLYGATQFNGVYQRGSIFELQHSNGTWSYRSLHDFTGGSDGWNPVGSLVMDVNGKLYGTTTMGGTGTGGCGLSGYAGCGVAFEITP